MSDFTIEGHIATREPLVGDIYAKLMRELSAFGPVGEEPKKTCIHLTVRTGFAGVYPRKNYINLEFRTDYPIDNQRIVKSEQVSKNRYHHTVKLAEPEQVDKELLGWLRDAYAMSV